MRRKARQQQLYVLGFLLLAVAGVILAAGCAEGEVADPFVGSWSVSGDGPPQLVIAKAPAGYRVAYLAYGETLSIWRYKRAADRLEAVFKIRDSGKKALAWARVIESRSAGDRLLVREGGGQIDLSKVGSSTAFPSPTPTSP